MADFRTLDYNRHEIYVDFINIFYDYMQKCVHLFKLTISTVCKFQYLLLNLLKSLQNDDINYYAIIHMY